MSRRWSLKYKRSINCRRPRGFSQKQYCKYGRGSRKPSRKKSKRRVKSRRYSRSKKRSRPKKMSKSPKKSRKKSRNKHHTKKKRKTYFKNYDLYSDANPKDTIRIKYDTVENTRKTIRKLESLRKSKRYTHARIVQVTNVMTQRLRVIYDKTGKAKTRYDMSKRYFEKLKKISKKSR